MTGNSTARAREDLLAAIEVGPAQIDEMSTIRHLHASSARRLAAGMLSEAETEAFAQHVYSESHSSRVAEAVMAGRLIAARLGGDLVATAGWTPANDAGAVARLTAVFVSPLYARNGIGSIVVAAVEAQARAAGFTVFNVRAPLGASGFFERIGYDIASHGVWPISRDVSLPVAFLRKAVTVPLGAPVVTSG